jgi:polar amino acid transport system ATP-binding protein
LIVDVQNVKKQFSGKTVLNGLSFGAEPGDLIALIGPSGCGKSTLLRCLNGLESLDSGQIIINGTTLKSPQEIGDADFLKRAQTVRQKVGMVFQSFNLFPHMNLLENIMKAQVVVQKKDYNDAKATAMKLLDKVGLQDHLEKYPNELSGGQQQRAAIARALALSPNVMLYDEPTSALDPMLVDEVLGVMKQLDTEGMTQIVVTHEMRFARDVADKIIYIEHGQIVEMGPPKEIFSQPKDERTRNFLRHFL